MNKGLHARLVSVLRKFDGMRATPETRRDMILAVQHEIPWASTAVIDTVLDALIDGSPAPDPYVMRNKTLPN